MIAAHQAGLYWKKQAGFIISRAEHASQNPEGDIP
jgi:hypothetical protein